MNIESMSHTLRDKCKQYKRHDADKYPHYVELRSRVPIVDVCGFCRFLLIKTNAHHFKMFKI